MLVPIRFESDTGFDHTNPVTKESTYDFDAASVSSVGSGRPVTVPPPTKTKLAVLVIVLPSLSTLLSIAFNCV